MGVLGNEAADELAGRGCDLPTPQFHCLNPYGNSFLPKKSNTNLTWRNPPAHHWYAARVLAYLYSAGVPGLIRRPWRALKAITCVV
ncbi:hypothetical protein TNCV_3061271 [Trichonephila clavipes]|nr:hypothetical protein TNCV_3061271 [Trichonephila clavipes]